MQAEREEKKREKAERDAEIAAEEYDSRNMEKVRTGDPCCGCNSGCANCCKAMAGLFYFLVIPALYAGLVFLEYQAHGFDRFLARSVGEGYNVTDDEDPYVFEKDEKSIS